MAVPGLKLVGSASVRGMDPEFQRRLANLIAAAPPDIQQGLGIFSGHRDQAKQDRLFAAAVKKYGSEQAARQWVAKKSEHTAGFAADMSYNGQSLQKAPANVVKWLHDNAGNYGLRFPLANENWHIEPVEARASGKPQYNLKLAAYPGLQDISGGPIPIPPANIPTAPQPMVRPASLSIPSRTPNNALDATQMFANGTRPSQEQVSAWYQGMPGMSSVPEPRPRPANMDAGGFNMAPPNLPLNAPLPPNRGASYGPNTGQWGPKIGQLGMQPIPASAIRAPTAVETMAEQRSYHPVPTLPPQNVQVASLAPVPMPGRPSFPMAAAPQAPTPMPGRPAGLTVAPPAPSMPSPAPTPPQRSLPPQAPAQPMLRLASGQMIAPGVYNQGDHSVQVSDAGDGTAKISMVRGPMAIPGVFDPLKEVNAPTIVGGMIRSMIPKVATDAVQNFNAPAAVDNVKSAAANAASNLGASLGGFGSGITGAFSGLGGLFGGPRPPAPMFPTQAQMQAMRNVPLSAYYPPQPRNRPLFAVAAPQQQRVALVAPVPVRTPNSVAVIGANDPDRYAQQVFGNPNGGAFGGSLAGF